MAVEPVHPEHHEHGSELSETELRVRALETVLTQKGYVDPAALDRLIDTYETKACPRGRRAACGLARVRYRAAGGRRDPRLGFDLRGALPGGADAPGRDRRMERGETRRARHARFRDRHRLAEIAGRGCMNGAHDM